MGNKARVALTGFAGFDNPEPGIGVAEALRSGWRGELEIDSLGYDAWQAGAWMHGHANRLHIIPPLALGAKTVFKRILEIHDQSPLDVLIPNLDLEVPVFSGLKPQLDKAGIQTLLPPQKSYQRTTKIGLPRFCYDNDILTPTTIHVQNIDEVPMYADSIGYPVMVKGSVAGAKKVNNSSQAYNDALKLHAQWGGGIILQNCIDEDEYCVAQVAREDGSCLGMVPMRKQGINRRGKAVVGSVVNAPDLERISLEILEKLQWRGPLELEFMRSNISGQFYLIEINCRFPSWIMLSAFAGCNLPVALLKEILTPGGKRLRRPNAGISFVRDTHDFVVCEKGFNKIERFGSVEALGSFPAKTTRKSNSKNKPVVAVTGISAFEEVLAGCGVSQALAQAPNRPRLLGLVYGPYDTSAHRPGTFEAIHRLPVEEDVEGLLANILNIQKRDGLDVIFPCIDFEIDRFLEIESELVANGVKVILPPAKAHARRGKFKLFSKRNKRDWGPLQLPLSKVVRKKKELKAAFEEFGFPIVIKGEMTGLNIAANPEEAKSIFLQMRDEGIETVLVQPFIQGDEFDFAAVCASDHSIIDGILIKKLSKNELGKNWGCATVNNPFLVDAISEFLKHLGWCGPVEVEMIRDVKNDCFVVVEVNPRFPAWISYGVQLGVNLPFLSMQRALGKDHSTSASNQRPIYMRSCETLMADPLDFATIATRGILQNGD